MTTPELEVRVSGLKSQIDAKLAEIAKDDRDLAALLSEYKEAQAALAASQAQDALIVDRTNRHTDASQGTSAR